MSWTKLSSSSIIIYCSGLTIAHSNRTGKVYVTLSDVIMGNGGFYWCLSEPQGVSAQWKETAQTRIRSFSFLVAESP